MANNDINIYFYSPTPVGDEELRSVGNDHSRFAFINTVPIFLNSYIKKTDESLYKRINWVKLSYLPKTREQLIAEVKDSGASVLCFSLYFWNNEHILEISKDIKQDLPGVLVLAGGPSVNVVRDDNYNKDHPDFDYTVYAQGEKPFYDILRHEFDGIPLSVLSTKNCSWIDTNGKVKKADYEFYRLTSGSPYIDSKHILERIIQDPEYSNCQFCLPWETSKGCPYNCSFCDWTSGLSHKVSKRKFAYEYEIEMFEELGIYMLYFSDANFGLHKEDKDIMLKLCAANDANGGKFKILSANFSKTKKDNVYDILEDALRSKLLLTYKCSIQDIHTHILDNIERPDIAWEDHKVYIENLKSKFPGLNPTVEMIQGLPGQTRETWENMLYEISSNGYTALIFRFIIIANAPAGYDSEWRNKMGIGTDNVVLEYGKSTEAVVSSYSFDTEDYAYFTLLTNLYYLVQQVTPTPDGIKLFKMIVEIITSSPEYDMLMPILTKYYNNIPKTVIVTECLFNNVIPQHLCKFDIENRKKYIKYYASQRDSKLSVDQLIKIDNAKKQ